MHTRILIFYFSTLMIIPYLNLCYSNIYDNIFKMIKISYERTRINMYHMIRELNIISNLRRKIENTHNIKSRSLDFSHTHKNTKRSVPPGGISYENAYISRDMYIYIYDYFSFFWVIEM